MDVRWVGIIDEEGKEDLRQSAPDFRCWLGVDKSKQSRVCASEGKAQRPVRAALLCFILTGWGRLRSPLSAIGSAREAKAHSDDL